MDAVGRRRRPRRTGSGSLGSDLVPSKPLLLLVVVLRGLRLPLHVLLVVRLRRRKRLLVMVLRLRRRGATAVVVWVRAAAVAGRVPRPRIHRREERSNRTRPGASRRAGAGG
jgi:hypothetical protein